MKESLHKALNRLCKWRSVFAGWQLGTRTSEDPECQAVRNHREVTILLRTEVSALLELLVAKQIITTPEWESQLETEAEHLSRMYAGQFPGFTATDSGLELNMPLVSQTTRGWRP
jgi:hypothetical protein